MSGRSVVRQPRRSWLLALLCLIASYAYITREQMPDMAGMAMSGMSMPMVDGPMPGLFTPQDQHGGDSTDHSLHCPFCFTAAFALGAEPPLLPPRGTVELPVRPALSARPERAQSPYVQARAPPLG